MGSTSISAIVATFIPTFLTAVLFLAIFVVIRNKYRKIYTPRTYIGVVPEKYIWTLDPNQFIAADGAFQRPNTPSCSWTLRLVPQL